jgi:hypothetical protein
MQIANGTPAQPYGVPSRLRCSLPVPRDAQVVSLIGERENCKQILKR